MRVLETAFYLGGSQRALAAASRLALHRRIGLRKSEATSRPRCAAFDRVDLVLLDASEPLADLLAASRELVRMRPAPVQVVLFEPTTSPATLFALAQAGVHGCIDVSGTASEHARALDRALAFSPALAPVAATTVGVRSWPETLRTVRSAMFAEAYARAGSKSGAAKLLGITRQAVQQGLRSTRKRDSAGATGSHSDVGVEQLRAKADR